MYSTIQNLISFYKKTTLNPDPNLENVSVGKKAYLAFRLWAFLFLIVFLSGILMDFVISKTGYDGENLNEEINNFPFFAGLMLVGVAVPIIEEILARLFLSKKPTLLALGILANILFLVLYISPLFLNFNEAINGILAIGVLLFFLGFSVIFIPAFWLLNAVFKKLESKGKLENLEKYATFLVYLSIIPFSLAHAGNWVGFEKNLNILPILILPQIILSFGLVFLRIRFGFFYSVLMHMFNNSFAFLLGFFALKVEGVGLNIYSIILLFLSIVLLSFAINEFLVYVKSRKNSLKV